MAKNPLHCSFCGRSRDEVKILIAGQEGHICENCVEHAREIIDQELVVREEKSSTSFKLTVKKPIEIKRFLDEYVIGQDEAKKVLAVAVYNHYKRLQQKANEFANNNDVEIEKSNIIMVGETGTGKTLLAKSIARMLNVPFTIVDATVFTEAGYVGEDVESILTRLLQVCNYDIAAAERGIVYIDEIDKIASGSKKGGGGPDVSREGVQRDLLPIVEGSTVNTKYGSIKTDHVLFVAAGAFHISKPSDLIPELQGRFPIRVELNNLTKDDFIRILKEPRNALTRQYEALFEAEGVVVSFTDDALEAILAHAPDAQGSDSASMPEEPPSEHTP